MTWQMNLKTNWHRCYTWGSMHAMAFVAALNGSWEMIPADIKSSTTTNYLHYMTAILLVLGMLARVQKTPDAKP